MEANNNLTTLINILQIVVTAAVTLFGAWLVYRNRLKESGDSVEVARVNNADDMIAAYGTLQTQLAQAAENMVKPLNLQIADQQKRILQQAEEIKQLRDFVKEKSQEQEKLTKRVAVLEDENQNLRNELARSLRVEKQLREKINRIRKDIDTGELSSSVHKIPTEDDNNGD